MNTPLLPKTTATTATAKKRKINMPLSKTLIPPAPVPSTTTLIPTNESSSTLVLPTTVPSSMILSDDATLADIPPSSLVLDAWGDEFDDIANEFDPIHTEHLILPDSPLHHDNSCGVTAYTTRDDSSCKVIAESILDDNSCSAVADSILDDHSGSGSGIIDIISSDTNCSVISDSMHENSSCNILADTIPSSSSLTSTDEDILASLFSHNVEGEIPDNTLSMCNNIGSGAHLMSPLPSKRIIPDKTSKVDSTDTKKWGGEDMDKALVKRFQKCLSELPREMQQLYVERLVSSVLNPTSFKQQVDAVTTLAVAAAKDVSSDGGCSDEKTSDSIRSLRHPLANAALENFLVRFNSSCSIDSRLQGTRMTSITTAIPTTGQ